MNARILNVSVGQHGDPHLGNNLWVYRCGVRYLWEKAKGDRPALRRDCPLCLSLFHRKRVRAGWRRLGVGGDSVLCASVRKVVIGQDWFAAHYSAINLEENMSKRIQQVVRE